MAVIAFLLPHQRARPARTVAISSPYTTISRDRLVMYLSRGKIRHAPFQPFENAALQ